MIGTDVVASLFLALCNSGTAAIALPMPPSQAGDVSGRVTDAAGTPLNGAVVGIEGTDFGGTTKPDGTYRITGVPDGQYTIRARRIGYTALTKAVTVAGGDVTLDLVLQFVPTQLEEVVVTGNLSRTEAKTVPAAVTIVTADEIEARGITKVDQVFKTVPGMGVLSDGQSDYYGNVTVRGGNSLVGNTTKVLIDGVEVADDEFQVNDVDPASIERIEIFRGPQASTIYGSAASGGLIQIITKKGEYTNRKTPGLEAKVSAGYNQTRSKYGSGAAMTENTLTLVGGGREFSYRIGGGFRKQGNWIENGYETSPSLFGHLRAIQGPLLLEANVRYLTRNFGWLYNPEFELVAPSIWGGFNAAKELNVSRTQSYSLHALYQATPHWTHDLTLGFEQVGGDSWSTAPTDSLGSQYIFIATWAQPSAKYRMGFDRRLGARVSSSFILGADYSARTNRFYGWNGVGDPNAGSIPRGGVVFVQSRYLHSSAFYAQEVLGVANNLFFTLGLRADRQLTTTIPVAYAWSPRAGVAYTRALGNVSAKIRASYGTVPSPIPSNVLQEFVLRRKIFHGNPNLRAPRLRGADVGLELYFGRRASFVATYYNQRPKDLIDLVVTHPDSAGFQVSTFQNVGEIHNRGWEFEGRLFLGRLTLLATYSPLRGTITKLSPDYEGDLIVGDRLLNVADWTASITASVTLPRTVILLTATPTGRHLNYDFTKLYAAEEDGSFDPDRVRQLYIIDYPGFTKFSLSVTQEVSRRYQAFLSVQDLFNTGTIETSDETIPKSRVTRVGLRIRP